MYSICIYFYFIFIIVILEIYCHTGRYIYIFFFLSQRFDFIENKWQIFSLCNYDFVIGEIGLLSVKCNSIDRHSTSMQISKGGCTIRVAPG